MLEQKKDKEIEKLFADVYKDRKTFLKKLLELLETNDEVLEELVKKDNKYPREQEHQEAVQHDYN